MIYAITSSLKHLIFAYRNYISRWLGPRCRYYPSCSEYALQCLDRFSLSRAFFKIILRLSKCNPLFPGGEDLP